MDARELDQLRQYVGQLVRESSVSAVSRLSGVTYNTVQKLVEGRGGVQRSTRDKIYALDRLRLAQTFNGATTASHGTTNYIRALVAMGYDFGWIARQVETTRTTISVHAHAKRPYVVAVLAERVKALAKQYGYLRAPVSQSSTTALHLAAKYGWLRLVDWEEELIELPPEEVEAELRRQVALCDDAELARMRRAYKKGERGQLTRAGARECNRRQGVKYAERMKQAAQRSAQARGGSVRIGA